MTAVCVGALLRVQQSRSRKLHREHTHTQSIVPVAIRYHHHRRRTNTHTQKVDREREGGSCSRAIDSVCRVLSVSWELDWLPDSWFSFLTYFSFKKPCCALQQNWSTKWITTTTTAVTTDTTTAEQRCDPSRGFIYTDLQYIRKRQLPIAFVVATLSTIENGGPYCGDQHACGLARWVSSDPLYSAKLFLPFPPSRIFLLRTFQVPRVYIHEASKGITQWTLLYYMPILHKARTSLLMFFFSKTEFKF